MIKFLLTLPCILMLSGGCATQSKEAEVFLSEAIERINKGFEAGRVTRQAVSSWLLGKACRELSEQDVRSISIPKIRLIPVIDTKLSGIERKKRVQALLSQMLLRAAKRGRPSKNPMEEEIKDAA